jgi:molybdenum cofactor cytidylyltransferase
MKAQTVDVKISTGRILCCTVFRPGGKKLLAKGHVISEDDIRILESEGMDKVRVTELEDGEVGEDDAVSAVAGEMGCGCYEIHLAAGGRANLHATENCCVLVDDELLRQINCTSSLVIATAMNFSFALAGQRIATVKSAPFAVAKDQLEAITTILRERGPIIQARPVRNPTIGVLFTDPLSGERARQLSRTSPSSASAFGLAPTFCCRAWKMMRPPAAACSTAAVAAVADSDRIHHGAGRP